MREVTCPVYPCVWSVVVNDAVLELAAADIAFRVHLRSHDADEIVAGFEALTAQNTRQLKHLGELNDELATVRKRLDEAREEALNQAAAVQLNVDQKELLRRQVFDARGQRDRAVSVVNAAREVVDLLRLLDELGLSGSVSGPSRALVVAMADYDATVEVADVRS